MGLDVVTFSTSKIQILPWVNAQVNVIVELGRCRPCYEHICGWLRLKTRELSITVAHVTGFGTTQITGKEQGELWEE